MWGFLQMDGRIPQPGYLVGHRYELQAKLGQGSMGVVYRAFDRLSQQAVALKEVIISPDQFASETLSDSHNSAHQLALAREFQLLASLRHPYIISVLDYGFDAQRPYFTMSLLEEPQDICQHAQTASFDAKIDLVLQMLQALTYLHRRGIVHRDLKPGNVLVDKRQRVQMVDFGLALQHEQVRETAGTLAYMAPEMFRDGEIGPAADLYAVGVMMFELFADRHPFDMDDLTRLIQQTLQEEADISLLPAALQPVVERLLVKEPAHRYPDAAATIQALLAAVGRPSLPETEAVRESFLQGAPFIGRQAELEQLMRALKEAIDGRGRAWLIGGESGVGKTRLLDEMRTQALVRGALVLKGQAASERGAPYHLWRGVLRRLCLHTPLSDLEAGVLQPLVPDIGILLGRPIAEAPELEAEATSSRLRTVVEALFQRQEQTTVLILEDLQWARESLDLLAYLTTRLAANRLFVLGSYRNDEEPDLPARLPAMEVIQLRRFSEQSIARLSVSMLGSETGSQEHIIQLLMRETEGNVYFLVEVVRALAEEAGDLEKIGQITLPQHVFATGIQTILRRRLNRVAPEAQPLLKVAAIRGRQIDLPLLRAVAPDTALDAWLRHGNDTAVLEVKEQVWQFSHDKLREALLGQLDPAESARLHRLVAQTIEQIYPDDPTQAMNLAYHWHWAGDGVRERQYRLAAGEVALANGANQQASELLAQAFELAVAQGVERAQQARILRLLGEAYLGLGDAPKARIAFMQTASLLDAVVPGGTARMGAHFLWQFGRQFGRIVRPARPSQKPERLFRYRELVHAYRLLGEIYFLNNEPLAAVFTTVRALNAAERIPPGPERMMLYANMAVAAALIPWHRLSRYYRRQALAAQEMLDAPHLAARCHMHLALAIYASVFADWEACVRLAGEAAHLAEAVGDYRQLGGALNVRASGLFNLGQNGAALALYARLYDTAVAQNNLMQQGWGLVNQTTCLLRMDQNLATAQQMLDEAIAIEHQVKDVVAQLNIYASLAELRLRLGQNQPALRAVNGALELMAANATSLGSYVGFHQTPVVYLTLWEKGNTAVIPDAQNALKRLRQYARIFKFARPIHLVCQGWHHWLRGRPEPAQAACRQAITLAAECQMPYEEGLAHYHLARFLPGEAPAARHHFQQAEALWRPIEALYMLRQLPTFDD